MTLLNMARAKITKDSWYLSIAYDKTNHVQLFFEEYLGSITDVSQFVYMVNKTDEYGYKKAVFILDGGYFRATNNH